MGNILVIGCASVDTLHLEINGKLEKHMTVGGAGLYTALAAAGCGADVTILAPRPKPMQERFLLLEKVTHWIGPNVSGTRMPELEIIHHGSGKATLLKAGWGAEEMLRPEILKAELQDQVFDIVHVAALSSAKRQLEFCRFFKGSRNLYKRISAGTYAKAILNDRNAARQMGDLVDLFFMNENEANLLYGSDAIEPRGEQIIFVTAGRDGATLHQSTGAIKLSAKNANEVDPTGAGDTFCGATLAGLSNDLDAETSAKLAIGFASKVIEKPGPSYWLDEQSLQDL